MYTKNDLIKIISNEFRIIKHLAEKIPENTEGYKPTEKQRTTLELIQYLSGIFKTTTEAVYLGDVSVFGNFMDTINKTTMENFAETMDTQETKTIEIINKFKDEDFETVINMFNQGEKTKGVYLIESILKFASAYKMQLFLYIKASGNTSLVTSNVWGGIDLPAQQ